MRFLLANGGTDVTMGADIIRLHSKKVMAKAIQRALLCSIGPCLLAGCASMPTTITSNRLPTAPRGIVLVVDGAGGYQEAPRAVIAAVNEAKMPLYVRSFDWTLGNNLGVADMTDTLNARAQAYRLSQEIISYRTSYPDTPLYIMAHTRPGPWSHSNRLNRSRLIASSASFCSRRLSPRTTTWGVRSARPDWALMSSPAGAIDFISVSAPRWSAPRMANSAAPRRAPLRFVYGRSSTSEHHLIPKLIRFLKKGDLLLLDSGFYCCTTFRKIMARSTHFIIPAKENLRPKVLRKLADSDYLCEIKDYSDDTPVTVRVVFVHRNGFRRRRLVTSLLDHVKFPASQLARRYHLRWDIETFYRDFKCALRATCWHCQSQAIFHQELIVHMIVCCLIRTAMLEGAHPNNLSIGQLSFTRALTETRLFFKKLAIAKACLWASIWTMYVRCCALYQVKYKPDRSFSRDKQEYRRKSRGLEKRRRGPKPKSMEASPMPKPETRKDLKGQIFLLN